MKYKQILKNASEITYYQDVFNDLEDVSFIQGRHDKWLITGYDMDGYLFAITIPYKVVKFLIKGRQLKCGLATPMARYYAYKALQRKEMMS